MTNWRRRARAAQVPLIYSTEDAGRLSTNRRTA